MTAALALLLSLAPAQTRNWTEVVRVSPPTAQQLTALRTFAGGLGIVRTQNLTYFSCLSGLEGQPATRNWACDNVHFAACVSEDQYDSLVDAGRVQHVFGMFGDVGFSAPSWMNTTGCNTGDWVIVRTVARSREVVGSDLTNLQAFFVEVWGALVNKVRAFEASRNVSSGVISIAVRGLKTGTRAEFKTAYTQRKIEQQLPAGHPDITD